MLASLETAKLKFMNVSASASASAFVQSAVNHRKTYDANHSAVIAVSFDNPNNRGAGIVQDI